jgi:hypothetical protein
MFILYLFVILQFFFQAGGKSIVLDANATSQLRNQGLASTDDSPKFQHKVRLFICGLATGTIRSNIQCLFGIVGDLDLIS